MRVGPQIDLVNKKTIMVAPEDHDRAKEVISNFLESSTDDEEVEMRYTAGQKLRMIIEALLFTWFIPGRKRVKTKS
jgi:RNA binding exosome subunit